MFANRARGVVLVATLAVAGLLGGTAAAQARDTGGALQPAQGAYDQQWQGHGRSMALYYDGLGTLTMSAGAADGEKWDVQWNRIGDGRVQVVLRNRTAVYGAGLGGDLKAGKTWQAQLVAAPDNGVTVMHFVDGTDGLMSDPNAGFFWCAPTIYGNSHFCGA